VPFLIDQRAMPKADSLGVLEALDCDANETSKHRQAWVKTNMLVLIAMVLNSIKYARNLCANDEKEMLPARR
jgi:hypothetical protein